MKCWMVVYYDLTITIGIGDLERDPMGAGGFWVRVFEGRF